MARGSRKLFQSGSRLARLFERFGSSVPAATAVPPLLPTAPPREGDLDPIRALMQQGRFGEAQSLCRQALARQPDDVEARLLLAEICLAQGDRGAAIELYSNVIELRPDQALAHYKRGNLLKDGEQLEAALADYDRAITLNPSYAYALCNRGVVLSRLNRLPAALESYDQAVAVAADDALAWFNRADVLRQLKRLEEAQASYDRAIAIRPDYLECLYNRGVLLVELRRPTEALASFDRALALKSDYVDAYFNRGLLLVELRRLTEALTAFDKAVGLKPDYFEAHFKRGALLIELGRFTEALVSFDRALALNCADHAVHSNRGLLLTELGRFTEALAALDKALALKPDHPEAHLIRATAFLRMKRYLEAIQAYDAVLAVKPDLRFALGLRQHCKMQICDWDGLDADTERILAGVRNGATVSPPFQILAVVEDESIQREAAQIWVRQECPVSRDLPELPARAPSDRLRIGYFSGDLYDHAVAVLTAELFESHDRSRFEITAFSLGNNTPSPIRRRLEQAFDRFVDVHDKPVRETAQLARSYDLDIAVDLSGHTDGARTAILARRVAPIQVAYLGYPGTLGADYIDYLIADLTVIPPEHQSHYGEKIVYLPHSYLPNDSTRSIDAAPAREEAGLPPEVFVFCCFNTSYKIMPQTFSSWMRILARVERSVLWLAQNNPVAVGNLQREARSRGIDPSRLIFANRIPAPSRHLARLRLADLFLDTLPYNAHATAIDALWAGVPVLTRIGRSFAGRVAASLLRSIELPELVTTSVEQYEDLAVELAKDSKLLGAIRRRLANNRLTTPLFDSRAFVRDLESAYTRISERYRAGLPPEHIYVAPAGRAAGVGV